MYDLTLPDEGVIVFDLDDTLYYERDFVYSGFQEVARATLDEAGADIFGKLCQQFEARCPDPFAAVLAEQGLPLDIKQRMIATYREHRPDIKLTHAVTELLDTLRNSGRVLGIITDGRSVTQRNKIRALGLDPWFDTIVISEEFGSSKPAPENYKHFERLFPRRQFVYVGNDVAKDFVAPNRLGWRTVGLLHHRRHIHLPSTGDIAADALPQEWIERLA